MDLNKIFALFERKNEDKPLSEEDNAIIDLYEKPLLWVGMFEKLIQHNSIFKQQLRSVFKNDTNYNPESLCDAGDAVVYNRAYMFISLIDLDTEEHKRAIHSRVKHSYLLISLINAINYFTSTEEYEKCIVLKKILNFAQESLEA